MSEVLPSLFYGAETWALNVKDYQELESFINLARLRLGNKRRLVDGLTLTNEALQDMVRLPTVAELLIPRQLSFFVGTVFKPSSLLARRMVFSKVRDPVGLKSGVEKTRYDTSIPAALEYWLRKVANQSPEGVTRGSPLHTFMVSMGLPEAWVISKPPSIDMSGVGGADAPASSQTDLGSAALPSIVVDITAAVGVLGSTVQSSSSQRVRSVLKSCWRVPSRVGERPYPDVQKKVEDHERVHACQACDKRYKERKALNRHVRECHQARPTASASWRGGSEQLLVLVGSGEGQDNLGSASTSGLQAAHELGRANTGKPCYAPHPESGTRNVSAPTVPEFTCMVEGCTKSYKTSGWLQRHIKVAHSNVPGDLAVTVRTKSPVAVSRDPGVVRYGSQPVDNTSRSGWRPGMECPYPGCRQRGKGAGWTCWKSVQNHMARTHGTNANTGGASRSRKSKAT